MLQIRRFTTGIAEDLSVAMDGVTARPQPADCSPTGRTQPGCDCPTGAIDCTDKGGESRLIWASFLRLVRGGGRSHPDDKSL
jgi:hypothetical protein